MKTPKRYAVVVGINDYEDDGIPGLKFALNDAHRVAQVLTERCGFCNEDVYVLSDGDDTGNTKAIRPTRSNILEKLQHVADAASEDDTVLFFFAGHGTEISKTPYLLTTDTKLKVLDKTAMIVTEVNEILQSSSAGVVLRFFDACRSPRAEARAMTARMAEGFENAILQSAKGWASLSACSSAEFSYEMPDLEQGLFSYYLCEGLIGAAADKNGDITFDRLVDYVQTALGLWCKEQGLTQTPHVQSDISGVIVLSKASRPAVTPPLPPTNPLSALLSGLETHLSQVPRDVRQLEFTNEDEHKRVVSLLSDAVFEATGGFSHPAMQIQVAGPSHLEFDGKLSNALHETKLVSEFKQQSDGLTISLAGAEVLVASSTIRIGVARFCFFYWLWYTQQWVQDPTQPAFRPQQPYANGFLMYRPDSAVDDRKVGEGVRELLGRAVERINSWNDELRDYVDNRLQPFRDAGERMR